MDAGGLFEDPPLAEVSMPPEVEAQGTSGSTEPGKFVYWTEQDLYISYPMHTVRTEMHGALNLVFEVEITE